MIKSTVSIIIPAYNQGIYLPQAIDSARTQSYEEVEIIIVDDGSTDNTADVAQCYSDPRISYIYQENRGLSGARNTGIRRTIGRYITFLDSDDLFLPKKIELLVSEMEKDPELGFVAGQALPIDERGNRVGKIFKNGVSGETSSLLLGNPFHVGSVLLQRSWQQKVGFFDESLRSYEDWDMWLRLALAGCKMGWLDQPVSLYRFHTAQMTRVSSQMTLATFAVLDKVFHNPSIPDEWKKLKDPAHSNAYLRAAAQAFLSKEYPLAKQYLRAAIRLNPELMANDSVLLSKKIAGWTELPKVGERLGFLESVYENLPGEFAALRHRKRQDLGRAAMEMAYKHYERGNLSEAQIYIRRAIHYRPGWLRNRGALSILVRSHLPISK